MSSTEPVTAPARTPMFGNCWSCRVLCGSGLIGAGGYVYMAARKGVQRGGPTSMGTVAQIVFALSIAAWGITILVDPVGKAKRKDA
ncbi:distal membrane-arm assembly complex protein 1 [Bombina bombina]|uniref:distal membrane-arm assembly complex protein 1 n=1 Tax=Bombina bombina TaxID=8345 RepID=UPI00235AD264|nr:distal membrane-arm assembly complex protein 1 [Bombina bombina]